MDFQSALIGQLDPTKRKQPGMDLGAMSGTGGIAGSNPNAGQMSPEIAQLGGGSNLRADGQVDSLAPNEATAMANRAKSPLFGAGGMGAALLPGGGIAPGEGSPNAGLAPVLDGARSSANTRLMEGDAGKLANPNHAQKSPKYDFLQLAQQGKYGYNQIPEMLKELQGGPNAKHWQGWENEKGDLVYKGDPSQLGKEWGGVTNVDVVGGFGADGSNAQGWRWGAGDEQGGAPAGPGGPGGGMFGGSSISPVLQGDAQGNIQSALGKLGAPSDLLQQLLAQLQGGS